MELLGRLDVDEQSMLSVPTSSRSRHRSAAATGDVGEQQTRVADNLGPAQLRRASPNAVMLCSTQEGLSNKGRQIRAIWLS